MQHKGLRRELGLFQVTMAGVGVILGAGIYALVGVASASAGNAVWLSFLISAFVAIFTGLSYAELSSMFKGDAGEYDYVKTAFNKPFAFIVAISMILGTIISSSTVALGFAGYFIQLIHMPLIAAAFLLIVLMTLINIIGIKQAGMFATYSGFIEIAGLVIILFIGLPKVGSVNYLEMPMGLTGVFSSAALVFFAYLGFEGIVKLRDETKNPERTIPLGIILSVLISSVLYVLVAVSAVSVIGWKQLSSSPAPLASVASAIFGSKAFVILAIAALFSTANTVLITMIAASRQLYGMAEEHSLPKFLSKVESNTGTPWGAILFTSALAVIFMFVGDIEFIANLTNLFLFIAFAAVNLSVIVLRYTREHTHRGFVCPGTIGKFSVVALLGFLTSLGMMWFVLLNIF